VEAQVAAALREAGSDTTRHASCKTHIEQATLNGNAVTLTENELLSIEEAVVKAESRTSVEILVVIAKRSGRYDRAEDLVGLLFGVVAMTVTWWSAMRVVFVHEGWNEYVTTTIGITTLVVSLLLGIAIGTLLAIYIPFLCRPLISSRMREEAVRAAGAEAYHQERVVRPTRAHAVLIYVSLFERVVWVAADDVVDTKLDGRIDGQGGWTASRWCQSTRDRIVEGFRSRQPAQGIIDAIGRCADQLQTAFPSSENSDDELPNRVRIIV
jgi:putative membrane protein